VTQRMSARMAMVLAALCVGDAADAQQQWQPQKAVELVVPTAAGGINDQLARVIQKTLQDQKMTAPSVVMNKPGGNQALAVVYLTQHASDAHYLLYSTPTLFTNQLAGLTPARYDALTPLALLLVEHTVFTVRADSQYRSMRELLAQLKSDPDAVAFGMVSRGGPNHLALAQAVRAAGADARKLKIAVFKTNAESMTALVGGHLHAVASSLSAALPQVQAGRARILAITAPQRMAGALASVPTLAEQGVNVKVVSNWRAMFGARGLAPQQVAYWEEALARTVASDEWKQQMEANQLQTRFMRGSELAGYLQGEYEATRLVMADLGLSK
jgi:putative tricarboxylic transport membrane protein